jgi:hypothetical protein
MGFSLSPERGHEGCIREVPQKDGCSSMYIDYYALSSFIYMYSRFMIRFVRLFSIRLSVFAIPASRRSNHNIDWCLFLQVKNKP